MAIAYDSRMMADEFTDAAALCLAANGIKTYVFKSLRPVPELSFAVRTLGCIAGIVITASHNPRENTTDTKYTGRMAHRSHRHTIKILLQKWQKSLIFDR